MKPEYFGVLKSVEIAFMNWKSTDQAIDCAAVAVTSIESFGTFSDMSLLGINGFLAQCKLRFGYQTIRYFLYFLFPALVFLV